MLQPLFRYPSKNILFLERIYSGAIALLSTGVNPGGKINIYDYQLLFMTLHALLLSSIPA
jgi:hypothetical protein